MANIPPHIHKEMDLSFDIADRTDAILNAKGWSHKDLAKALNKTEGEVSRWLTGRHDFTLRTLAKISCVLNSDIIKVAKF